MPNWCNNYLTIECDENTLNTIKSKLEYAKSYSGSLGQLKKQYEKDLSYVQSDEDRQRITSEYEMKKRKLEDSGIDDDDVLIFKTLVGLPPDVNKDEYNANWYNINVDNYGTKWDVRYDEYSWDFDNGGISVSFETAWSPPEGFCNMLMSQYKGITLLVLQYEEGGCDFCGKYTLDREAGQDDFNANDECYRYLEGLYKLDQVDCFWNEAENYLDNDFDSVEDYIAYFSFLDPENDTDKLTINELKTMYEEHFAEAE